MPFIIFNIWGFAGVKYFSLRKTSLEGNIPSKGWGREGLPHSQLPIGEKCELREDNRMRPYKG